MITRDLHALDREIAAYPDDESLWLTSSGIGNSAGNLALHLCGNLRHFIGGTLGKTGYVRNRDAEFTARGLTREQVRAEVRSTIADIDTTLERLTDDALAAPYHLPLVQPPRTVRTTDWLVHLATHLAYHLGQIDYHRRLLTSSTDAANALSVKDIPEVS